MSFELALQRIGLQAVCLANCCRD